MLHQNIESHGFYYFLLGFPAIYLSFKCIQLEKNIFLLNIGTIKNKDGLMFLVPANLGLDVSTLKDALFVKGLFSMENPLWSVLVKFSLSCFVFHVREGERRIFSNPSTHFYLDDRFNNFLHKT